MSICQRCGMAFSCAMLGEQDGPCWCTAMPAVLPVQTDPVDAWVTRTDDSPTVRKARVAYEIARLETKRTDAGNMPTEPLMILGDVDTLQIRADVDEQNAPLVQADQPADLAYHLGKNPDLARSLSSMPPQAAAYALGKIAAGLQVPQPKIASNAPPPNTITSKILARQ